MPHPSPFTLHPSPFTLHPSPFTLHPSPFILHPSSFILRSSPLAPPHPWFQTPKPISRTQVCGSDGTSPSQSSPSHKTHLHFVCFVSFVVQKTPPSICVDLCLSVVQKTNPPAQRLGWNFALPATTPSAKRKTHPKTTNRRGSGSSTFQGWVAE